MTQSIDDLVSQAQERFAAAKDAAALENEKARFLGKDGALTVLLKGLGKLDPEQKREMGAQINQAKKKVEEFLNLGAALAQAELDARLASETIDVTLPGRGRAGRHSSGDPDLGARGRDLPLHRLRRGRWPRSRERLDQLHRPE